MKKELELVQRQIDIARSRSITMKDILAFGKVEDSFLFEDERTSKTDKCQLIKYLEAFIEIDDFWLSKTKTTKTLCHCWFHVVGT